MSAITYNDVDLSTLTVRPIRKGERSSWDHLVEQHHYLHSSRLGGEMNRYVAILQNKWAALLGWSGPSFKLAARDNWIGWCQKQHRQRLKYLINNSRFLILPGIRIKNLASKALALNLQRISADWVKSYGHPIAMVETFVDPSQFNATSYRAAGFIEVGRTKGYGIHAGNYYHHGQRKLILLRPVKRRAKELLTAPFLSPILLEGSERKPLADLNRLNLYQEDGLLERLGAVPEWRKGRGRRHHRSIVFSLIVCAILAGVKNEYIEISRWLESIPFRYFKRYFGCRRIYGRPSEPTIRRSLQSVDSEKLCKIVSSWLCSQNKAEIIAPVVERLQSLCKSQLGTSISSKAGEVS